MNKKNLFGKEAKKYVSKVYHLDEYFHMQETVVLDTRVTELENAEPPEIDTSTLVSLETFNKVINNETVLQRRSNGSFYLGTNLTSISDAAKNNTIPIVSTAFIFLKS